MMETKMMETKMIKTKTTTKNLSRGGNPVATMLAQGGVVYVPPDAYLRRLQRLYRSGNAKAHANSLYPGLAHIATTTTSGLAALLRSIFTVSEAGRNLHGLESLFLSCLQGVQTSGDSRLVLAGVAAWARYAPGKHRWPLIVVDRATNQFAYIPPEQVSKTLHGLRPAVLFGTSVWDVLKSLQGERAIATTPGNFKSPANGTDAADDPVGECKDKVGAWVNTVTGVLAGVGLAANGTSTAGLSSTANLVQIGQAIFQGVATLVATFGCPIAVWLSTPSETADTSVAGVTGPPEGPPSDPSEWSPWPVVSSGIGVGDSSGNGTGTGTTQNSTDNSNKTDDPEAEWNAWPGSDPATEPPPPPLPDGGTPDPDSAGESHSRPPGFSGPWPNGDMPNPDDIGGGPVSMPNGAVFVPTRTLRTLGLISARSVSVTQVGQSKTGVATFQLAVSASALGAGIV